MDTNAMDTVALIKERLDLVDFLRGYLTLIPAGRSMKALCPFHKEKTPSFSVSPERQVWHCFGCNSGGDLFEFVMKYENLEFFEALKVLAEKAGVDLKRFGGQDQKQFAILYEIQDAAKQFFAAELARDTPAAKTARVYLAERGLREETIKEFELGLAPSSSDALSRHLVKLGYRIADVERAGFVMKTERGTYWDRFRGRIMFPLHNHFGKVIAFTGRVLPGGEGEGIGKYVNSPETPIFVKSKLLFGFHKAKGAIRDLRTAVVIEGQMDFLMLWQEGIRHAVATSGTAVTEEHLKPLRRIADTLVVGFDNDEAGMRAGERAIDLAEAADFVVQVIPAFAMPGVKDPADAVKLHPGLMAKLIGEARPAMEWYFDRYLPRESERSTLGLALWKQALRTVLRKVSVIASPVERARWLRELAARTRVPEHALMEELAALAPARANASSPEASSASAAPLSRYELIARRLLSIALRAEGTQPLMSDARAYFPPLYQPLAEAASVGTRFPAEAGALADDIALRAGLLGDDPESLRLEFDGLVRELKAEYYRAEQAAVQTRIRECETRADAAGLAAALADFDRITKLLNTT